MSIGRSSALSALAMLAFLAPWLVAQDASRESRITITHRQPLAEAAQLFESRYGVAVTYEDAPLGYVGDVVDRVFPDASPVARTMSGLKTIRLEFQLPVKAEQGQEHELFERVLAAHELAGGVGRYRVIQEGRVLHVIPTQSRGPDGTWVPVEPILDRRISFPSEDRSANDFIGLVLQKVNAVGGVGKVGLGMAPVNTMLRHRTRLGARDQPARDVLDAFCEELGWRLTWSLYYPTTGWKPMPSNMRPVPLFSGTFVFDISGVATASPSSITEQRP